MDDVGATDEFSSIRATEIPYHVYTQYGGTITCYTSMN